MFEVRSCKLCTVGIIVQVRQGTWLSTVADLPFERPVSRQRFYMFGLMHLIMDPALVSSTTHHEQPGSRLCLLHMQGEYGLTNVLMSHGYNIATLMARYSPVSSRTIVFPV